MPFSGDLFDESWLIPVEPGQAVDAGWPEISGGKPHGITWHWTATRDRAECDRLLGGANAARRGVASAHYAVGRTREEGVARYVSLENRAWHAGKNQLLRWDGRAYAGEDDKGSRTCIGVETVHVGFAREGVPAGPDWIEADSADGRQRMRVPPWPEEQIELMVAVGREILERWPQIGPRDHHGHHDLCPTWKVDPAGFPFAEILRRLYGDPTIPDVWTPTWKIEGRRHWLQRLGYGAHFVPDESVWWQADDLALRRFQQAEGLPVNGFFTTHVAWRMWDRLGNRNNGGGWSGTPTGSGT